jgi:hypothetical protein
MRRQGCGRAVPLVVSQGTHYGAAIVGSAEWIRLFARTLTRMVHARALAEALPSQA